MRGYIFTKNEKQMLLLWLKGKKPKGIRSLRHRVRRAKGRIESDYKLLRKAWERCRVI